jgi:hypothetical protein
VQVLAVKDGIEQMLEQFDLTDDFEVFEGDRDATAAFAWRLPDIPTLAGPTAERTRHSPPATMAATASYPSYDPEYRQRRTTWHCAWPASSEPPSAS